MLSIGVIGGWGGDGRSAGYYTASVARGRDDYYTGVSSRSSLNCTIVWVRAIGQR